MSRRGPMPMPARPQMSQSTPFQRLGSWVLGCCVLPVHIQQSYGHVLCISRSVPHMVHHSPTVESPHSNFNGQAQAYAPAFGRALWPCGLLTRRHPLRGHCPCCCFHRQSSASAHCPCRPPAKPVANAGVGPVVAYALAFVLAAAAQDPGYSSRCWGHCCQQEALPSVADSATSQN